MTDTNDDASALPDHGRLLAQFARFALDDRSIQSLLHEACKAAGEGLDAPLAKVLEHVPAQRRFVVRAGIGWHPGVVGVATIDADPGTAPGYALRTGQPVISDHPSEGRFRTPQLLIDHGVQRAINVVIGDPEYAPFGVLETDSTDRDDFRSQDVAFLESLANMLSIVLARHQREERLRDSEQRLRRVLDLAPVAIIEADAQGVFRFVNPAAQAILRLAPAIDGVRFDAPLWHVAAPDGSQLSPDNLPAARALRGEVVLGYEHRIGDGAGHNVLLRVNATPVRDTHGAVVGMIAAFGDVTDRQATDKATREAADDFHALGENLPNLCWIAHADGSIYWYNKAWYDYTGTVPTDMEGWGWQSVHDPDVLPSVMERWTASIASGAPFEMTFPLKGADGTFRPFLTRVSPVRDGDGAIIRWFGNNVDVGEQLATAAALRASEDALRRLNEQLEARVAQEIVAREEAQARLAQAHRMEALGQLAGGIAHDFNNVLQAVAGGLTLIQKRADDPQIVRQLARMAGDAVVRGSSITGRLLAFARRDALRAVTVDVYELLENLSEMLTPTLGPDVSIRIEAGSGVHPLAADKAQLETVLVNLAVNARDAMPDGGTLTIAAASDDVVEDRERPAPLKSGRYVELRLSDNGTGMDAMTLERASEPFFTTKPPGQGTGLGLAMARGFAEQSGGGFAIESAPGEGTTVTLWFPRAERLISEPVVGRRKAASSSSAKVAHILVVDDDKMVRDVLVRQMQEWGYHVHEAADGLSALAVVESGVLFDLLVTDFAMPSMTGLQLIAAVRERQPTLPAVLLTGFADAGSLESAGSLQDGTTVVLRKPVSADDLRDRIQASLSEP